MPLYPELPGPSNTHNIIPFADLRTFRWFVVNRTGDFPLPIEDMLSNYLQGQWSAAVIPPKSINPPADFSSKVRFGDFQYDYFSTYYIRLKEADTEFNNDLIIDNTFQMNTAVNIDLTARRLKTGENFAELNNMRLEVIRILGNYRPDGIVGVHMIEIKAPGERDIEPRTLEGNRSIWYLRIIAHLHYIKGYECIVQAPSPPPAPITTASFMADSFMADSFDV